jgi:uncharacterized membrane protein
VVQQRALWGGPVEADRVLAFSDAIFAIAITLLTLNLEVPAGLHGDDLTRALHQVLPALGASALSFVILGQLWLAHHRIFGVIARVDYTLLVRNLLFLGLIAIMPFPVRLLSDYTRRPMAVAIYAVAFIAAMQLQRLIWLDVTRPEHRDLLREPVPAEVRKGFGRVLLGMLVVFGAAVPVEVRPQVQDPGLGGDHPPPPGRGPAHQLAGVASHRKLESSGPGAYRRCLGVRKLCPEAWL